MSREPLTESEIFDLAGKYGLSTGKISDLVKELGVKVVAEPTVQLELDALQFKALEEGISHLLICANHNRVYTKYYPQLRSIESKLAYIRLENS